MATPEDLINQARSDASGTYADAMAALYQGQAALEKFQPKVLPSVTTPATFTFNQPQPRTPPKPTAVRIEPTEPPPQVTGLVATPSLNIPLEPTLTATVPGLSTIQVAELEPFAEEAPPIKTDFDFPRLTLPVMPAPPAPIVISKPLKPGPIDASLSLTPLTELPAAPSDMELDVDATISRVTATEDDLYGRVTRFVATLDPAHADAMRRLNDMIDSMMAGGTGISPEVEQAIYNRARARNDVEAMRTQNAVMADIAARGFSMPNGAVLSAMNRARQEAATNNNKTNNEIAISSAELEQKNRQFAVTSATGFRTMMVQVMDGYMKSLIGLYSQATDVAKMTLSAKLDAYRAAVDAWKARADYNRAEISVFEARIQAGLGLVKMYEAELQAANVEREGERNQVEVYKARIDILNAEVAAHKSQVEAIVSEASLEKLKVELYQAQVQAYAARAQAKSTEWEGYGARMRGEATKVEAYTARVSAYGKQVEAYEASIRAQAENVKAVSQSNEAILKESASRWAAYSAEVQAKGAVASTELESQRQMIYAYQAEAQTLIANAQVSAEYYKSASTVAIEKSKFDLEKALAQVSVAQEFVKAATQLHLKKADMSSSLASASLAGLNVLAATTADV
jgi:hypothetical protein